MLDLWHVSLIFSFFFKISIWSIFLVILYRILVSIFQTLCISANMLSENLNFSFNKLVPLAHLITINIYTSNWSLERFIWNQDELKTSQWNHTMNSVFLSIKTIISFPNTWHEIDSQREGKHGHDTDIIQGRFPIESHIWCRRTSYNFPSPGSGQQTSCFGSGLSASHHKSQGTNIDACILIY